MCLKSNAEFYLVFLDKVSEPSKEPIKKTVWPTS